MPEPLKPYDKKVYYQDYTTKNVPTEPYYEPTYPPVPDIQPLPKYYPPYLKAKHNPIIPYREITTKGYPNVPYYHTFPKYTTTTTTTTTTTYTTTTTTTTYTTTTTTTTTTYTTTTTTTTWYKP